MADSAARIAQLQKTLAELEDKRNSAINRIEQRGRLVSIDLAAVDRAISTVSAELSALQNTKPMVRRLLTSTPTKGL